MKKLAILTAAAVISLGLSVDAKAAVTGVEIDNATLQQFIDDFHWNPSGNTTLDIKLVGGGITQYLSGVTNFSNFTLTANFGGNLVKGLFTSTTSLPALSVNNDYSTFSAAGLSTNLTPVSPGSSGFTSSSWYWNFLGGGGIEVWAGINPAYGTPPQEKFAFGGQAGGIPAVPVPATLPLFISALAGLGILKRRSNLAGRAA